MRHVIQPAYTHTGKRCSAGFFRLSAPARSKIFSGLITNFKEPGTSTSILVMPHLRATTFGATKDFFGRGPRTPTSILWGPTSAASGLRPPRASEGFFRVGEPRTSTSHILWMPHRDCRRQSRVLLPPYKSKPPAYSK